MPSYTVRMPIAGYLEAYVTADSEDEAIDKARNMNDRDSDTELFYENLKHIVKGNVFYGSLNEIEVMLEDDDED